MRHEFLFVLLCLVYHQANAAAPTFYQPGPGGTTKSIAENINSGSGVYDLIGSDADGDSLAYSIKSQTPSSPAFTIVGGELKAPSGLDAETATSFSLVFTVSDGTSTADSVPLVITVIDVNEFTPQFSGEPYSGSIQDGTAAGTIVTTVTAIDQDVTDTVSYSITAGDPRSTFAIDSRSGVITVINAGNVDSATTPSYSITVRASDGTKTADTTVTITVTATPCNPNPCQNSGTCSASGSSGSSATCKCTSGYIGATCDTVDYCASTPCQNLGTCTNDASTFTCSCAPGFIGNQCQTVDPCFVNPCENSGTCSVNGTTYSCACASGYIGYTCDTVDPCFMNPCENAGICSRTGTTYSCECANGFTGIMCDTAAPAKDTESSSEAILKAAVIGGLVGALSIIVVVVVVAVVVFLVWKRRGISCIGERQSTESTRQRVELCELEGTRNKGQTGPTEFDNESTDTQPYEIPKSTGHTDYYEQPQTNRTNSPQCAYDSSDAFPYETLQTNRESGTKAYAQLQL